MTHYDFHLHSNHSDADWSVDQLLEFAQKIGMKGLVLTDHDTFDGQKEFIEKASKTGIRTNTGIEITATYNDKELHILGYGLDPKDQALNTILVENRGAREVRNQKLIAKLRELGFIIPDEKVEAGKRKNGYYGRLLIANIMLSEEINHKLIKNLSIQGIFDEYLRKDAIGYVMTERNNPELTIKLIHQAGGIAVLAHPYEQFKTTEAFKTATHELIKLGLDGIEVYTKKHTPEQSAFYKDFAIKNDLLITLGSDDHGESKVPRSMGQIFTENEEEIAENFFSRLKK